MRHAVKLTGPALSLEETAAQLGVTKRRQADILAVLSTRASEDALRNGRYKAYTAKRTAKKSSSNRTAGAKRQK